MTKALLAYGARMPKELMLFVKDMLFLDGAIATLAPDVDLFAEITQVATYFATRHGERIVNDIGIDPRQQPVDLDGFKASMGVNADVDADLPRPPGPPGGHPQAHGQRERPGRSARAWNRLTSLRRKPPRKGDWKPAPAAAWRGYSAQRPEPHDGVREDPASGASCEASYGGSPMSRNAVARAARRRRAEGRREVGDQAGAGPTGLLQGQLDPQIVTGVAVVEHGDGPGQLGALRVVGRMIVTAVVGKFLHGRAMWSWS